MIKKIISDNLFVSVSVSLSSFLIGCGGGGRSLTPTTTISESTTTKNYSKMFEWSTNLFADTFK